MNRLRLFIIRTAYRVAVGLSRRGEIHCKGCLSRDARVLGWWIEFRKDATTHVNDARNTWH